MEVGPHKKKRDHADYSGTRGHDLQSSTRGDLVSVTDSGTKENHLAHDALLKFWIVLQNILMICQCEFKWFVLPHSHAGLLDDALRVVMLGLILSMSLTMISSIGRTMGHAWLLISSNFIPPHIMFGIVKHIGG